MNLSRCIDSRWLSAVLFGSWLAMASPAAANVPPLPAPDIDPVIAGDVTVLHKLADGRTLVGGSFTRLGNVQAAGCGRLLPDGSADAGFQCGVSNAKAFATDASNRVYVLRDGSPNLVRLLPDGALDTSFAALTETGIGVMAIADGAIYLGGNFTTLAGSPRVRLARLSLDGVLDPAWNPAVDAAVTSMLGPGDGFLYIGGAFDNVAGAARARVARVSLATGASDAWNAALASTLSGFEVTSMATDGSHLYLSGAFDSVQGQQRRRLAKIGLDAAATLDPTWAPQVLDAPTQFSGPRLLQVVGAHVYIGDTIGDHLVESNGAQKSARMLRVSRNGSATLDLAFDPFADVSGTSANGPRAVVTGDGGGRLFVGGAVSELSAGEIRLGLAALNANGSVDTLSALSEARRVASVGQLAVDTVDGSLYVQGSFLRVNGVLRFGLVRLLPGGTVDGGFRPPAGRYSAVALAGGAVYAADDKARLLRKLDPVSGDPVAGFVPIPYSQSINQLLAGPGHLYLLGSFQLSGITPSLGRFARVDLASGTVDTSFRFTPNAGGSINGQTLDAASSSLFLFGQFSSINGQARQNLARIDLLSSTLDGAFAPAIPTPLSAAVADGQGGLWLSGGFTTINGAACRAPARLLIASAGLDPAFSCVRSPIGFGSLTFAADAIYGVFSSSLRRFRYADGGSADPDWLLTGTPTPLALASFGDRIFVSGSYEELAGVQRRGLAALPTVERYFRNGFE